MNEMPTLPPLPLPALVINLSMPMVIGGEVIPQPLWTQSQIKDYAQHHAMQFERAAVSLAIDRADLAAEVKRLRSLLDKHNQECHELCEARKASGTLCAALERCGKKCPDCPKDNVLGA